MPHIEEQQHRENDPQGGQDVFPDFPAERHAECHALVLDEEYLEPFPEDRDGLPYVHAGLDQDLGDLIEYQQRYSKNDDEGCFLTAGEVLHFFLELSLASMLRVA